MIHDPAQARCLMQPGRISILKALRSPGSAASVARELKMPRQKVTYHVRQLEGVGLVSKKGERKVGNCMEQLLQASAQRYAIAPEVLGALGADAQAVADRFSSAFMVASALEVASDVTRLREGAAEAGQKLATLTIDSEVAFASPREQYDFARELERTISQLVQRYHQPGAEARAFTLRAFAHPTPTNPGNDADD